MTIFEQMTGIFTTLKNTLEVCRATPLTAPEREKKEAELCLATRDAYTDFHSLSLVHQVIDPIAKVKLARYLSDALDEFEHKDFINAVSERNQEFLIFCDWMENNRNLTELVLAELMSEETKL